LPFQFPYPSIFATCYPFPEIFTSFPFPPNRANSPFYPSVRSSSPSYFTSTLITLKFELDLYFMIPNNSTKFEIRSQVISGNHWGRTEGWTDTYTSNQTNPLSTEHMKLIGSFLKRSLELKYKSPDVRIFFLLFWYCLPIFKFEIRSQVISGNHWGRTEGWTDTYTSNQTKGIT
jgi:hypothetical protein